MKPKKSLGQNFLKDRSVLARFIKACDLKPEDVVIEVGAGTGTITAVLARRVKQVIAYEIDPALYARLNHLNLRNVELRNTNILKELRARSEKIGKPTKIVGAIPYQITSPLLHKIILSSTPKTLTSEEKPPICGLEGGYSTGIVFIIQLEVAQKIVARPPKATYLSNLVQTFGQAEIVGPPIPPEAFWPEPKVRSTILRVKPYLVEYPPARCNTGISTSWVQEATSSPTFDFSRFLHRGFKNPRKMLNKALPKEVLSQAGIDSTLRPQNLTLEEWLRIFSYTRRADG